MILSDKTIRGLIQAGELCISPLDDVQIQPASVDIRLGDTFTVVKNEVTFITFGTEIEYEVIKRKDFVLRPKCFILATTTEYFKLPNNMTAFVEGRSSVGRMGLFIQNAGWVDPGFEGEITLELFNASDTPILLEAGTRIGQLVFAQLDRDALNPYRGKYQGQKGATGSRIHLDHERVMAK